MPQIRTYKSEVAGLDTSALKSGDASAAAGAASGFLQGAAGGLKVLGQRLTEVESANETSKLAADLAAAQADLSKKWQDTARSADPNDPDTASKFLSGVADPAISQIGDNLKTQAGRLMFQKASAGMRADFFTKTATDQAAIAGDAAVNNYVMMQNSLTSAVLSDPSSQANSMSLGNLAIDGLTQLPANKRDELKLQLGKKVASAAIVGLANSNPDAAEKELNSGKHDAFLDAGDKEALASKINTVRTAREADMRAAQVAQKAAEKQQADEATNKLIATTINPDTGQLQISSDFFKAAADLSHLPGQSPGQSRAMVDYGRAVLSDQEKGVPSITDPHTYESLSQRMFLPENDPDHLSMAEVFRARADRMLSDKDFTFFHESVTSAAADPKRAQRDKDFSQMMAGYKGFITKSNPLSGAITPMGDQKFYEFQRDARAIYDQGLTSGKSLLDIEKQIANTVGGYALSKKDSLNAIKNMSKGLTPSAPVESTARKPGESAGDFLKRTGGQ